MREFELRQTQRFRDPLETVFAFFADPANLDGGAGFRPVQRFLERSAHAAFHDPIPAAISGSSMRFLSELMDNCAICIEPWIKMAKYWISWCRRGGMRKPRPVSFEGSSNNRAKRLGGS